MKTVNEFYRVTYIHKSGSKGVLGMEHKTLQDAINQVNTLKSDSYKEYSEYRDYSVEHVIKTEEINVIPLKPATVLSI